MCLWPDPGQDAVADRQAVFRIPGCASIGLKPFLGQMVGVDDLDSLLLNRT